MLPPGTPERKGGVERTIGYLETSFLPLRGFVDLADLRGQHDRWAEEVAYGRRPRRLAGTVEGALAVERGFLRALPGSLPDVSRRTEARVSTDGFVRVGNVERSVPPQLAGRRVGVRVSPEEVVACSSPSSPPATSGVRGCPGHP